MPRVQAVVEATAAEALAEVASVLTAKVPAAPGAVAPVPVLAAPARVVLAAEASLPIATAPARVVLGAAALLRMTTAPARVVAAAAPARVLPAALVLEAPVSAAQLLLTAIRAQAAMVLVLEEPLKILETKYCSIDKYHKS